MIHRSDPDIVKRLNLFAAAAAIFSMMVGLSVLVGWTLNIAALLTWGAGTPMAPNAAACFVLAGFSLWLFREERKQPSKSSGKLAARAAAVMVSLGGLLTLMEQLFRRDFGINRLLLLRPPGPQVASFRILMSPIAAGAFLLLGVALLGIDWRTRRKKWPAQLLCLAAAFAPVFGLLGLIVGPRVSPTTLALPAVAGFVALTAGLLCSRPTWAIGGLLTRQSRGARLLRAALPAALVVLGLLGWLISKPLLSEVHFTWVEVTLLAIVTGAMLAGFIGWTALVVDRSDDEQRKVEEALHLDQEQVERLLAQIAQPESDAHLRRWVKSAVAVAVLLISVTGILSWHMMTQSAEDAAWVAHTYNVSRTLELALRHLDDVETGARGFALTGEEQFLEPFQSGKYAVSADLEGLRVLVSDNPGQGRRLDVLVEQTRNRLEAAEDLVALRKSSGQLQAAALERGRQLMDAVRTSIATMEMEETRLLEQRTRRARRARHFAESAVGLGSILGVIFLSIAGIAVRREIRATARAQAQVKALNAGLERRVEQRTAALAVEAAVREGTEAKLRSSEQMFRMLLDGITDYAVYMLDVEGRVVSWNSGAARIKGYSAKEIIGKHVSCFYTATDQERNCPQDSLREAADTGRFEGEGWRVRKDGSAFWAHAVITPVYQPDGSLSGYSKVVRDITTRKQAEEELKKQAALLDLAHDAILVRDLESRVVFWNRGAQHMYGWSAGEAEGRVTHSFLQTTFPVPLSTIEAVIASKGEWEGELRHRTRHGTEVIVASRWSLLRDERGSPTAILEINRDITDRKRAEAALSESEGRLAGVIASAMDSIITVDDQHLIVLFNRAAE
jgi:PAS domain S-box-containing protein